MPSYIDEQRWPPSTTVIVYSKDAQKMICNVTNSILGVSFTVVVLYADNEVGPRSRLWEEISLFAQDSRLQNQPWAIMGDFNQALNLDEQFSDSISVAPSQGMSEFQNCLYTSHLFDLPFQGPIFTWTNRQPRRPIARKLDRFLITEQWLHSFPQSKALFEAAGDSDHTRCLIRIKDELPRPKTFFKYFNFIATHPEFQSSIRTRWEEVQPRGNEMFKFCKKMREMKGICRDLNKSGFSNIQERTQAAKDSLIRIQTQALQGPTEELFQQEREHRMVWQRLANAEESYFRQKSRVQWLKDGDKNTSYFHRVVQARQAKRYINSLLNDDGDRVTSSEGLRELILQYYQRLLGTVNLECHPMTVEEIQIIQPYRCDADMRDKLAQIPTAQEITEIVFSMPLNKAPGPDGFPVDFYIKTWAIVGDSLIKAVREFFISGKLLRQVNATAISLIPKIQGAERIDEFRPVSCCNTIYKIISKIIASRINMFITAAVQSNQTGFLKGRTISENVLLAAELVTKFNKSNGTKRGCLKVDLAKAFDNVNWQLVINTLRALQVPDCMVSWIRECISTASFSVNFNGELIGYFAGKKGLRQGDPISSYLFVLILDLLSKKLDKAARESKFGLHPLCKEPLVTHLSFADDLLVFFDGKDSSLAGILGVFEEFYIGSGLKLNSTKSVLYLDGNNPDLQENLAYRYNLTHGSLPVRYLGLPLITQQMRKNEYGILTGRIKQRINSWLVKHLSFAGRLQLIKSVINSTVNFWLSVFRLPRQCIIEIEKMCSAFLWTGDSKSAKGAKIAWRTVCTPKKCGGLGLKNLTEWNQIFGLKLIWRIYSKEASLWADWVRHHLITKGFWKDNYKVRGSWVWKQIVKNRGIAKLFISCRINSGDSALFWLDNWTSTGPLIDLIGDTGPQLTGIRLLATVKDAIRLQDWRLPRSRNPIVQLLRNILPVHPPILNAQVQDEFQWKTSSAGTTTKFSAKATWELLQSEHLSLPWTDLVWFKDHIPKHAFITWIAAWNRLPTKDRLKNWGLDVDENCLLCSLEPENRDHLMTSCRFAVELRRELLGTDAGFGRGFMEVMMELRHHSNKTEEHRIKSLLFQATVYELWKERNNRLHGRESRTIIAIKQEILTIIRSRLFAISQEHNRHSVGLKLLEIWFKKYHITIPAQVPPPATTPIQPT